MEIISYGAIIGDLCYFTATSILLIRFIKTKSCSGFSGKMQIIYSLVFTTKTTCLIFASPSVTLYYVLKTIILTVVSYIILYLMYRMYAKTYENEFDKFWIEAIIIFALCISLLESNDISSPESIMESFSGYLEALVLLPQVYFTYRSEGYYNVVSIYMLFLTIYNSLYILHWLHRYNSDGSWDPYTGYATFVGAFIGLSYFLLMFALKKEYGKPEILPYKPKPTLMHQNSLLESPLLKRSMPSSSSLCTVYTISQDGSSNSSSPNGSLQDFKIDGRY
ncbi:ER lumen protein-retaining receptor 3-like [Cimex lectularius]|uniref:Uncharacterized protein n=1 Tax=Cimex lectularius TaxID=79782 RepID=A0A8I6S1Q9_CIMLE|nr:ER lumen protein-retaining receptor 3-like [Cimex lectularius]